MNAELKAITMDRRLANTRLVRRLTKTPEPVAAAAPEQKPEKKTAQAAVPPAVKVAPA